MKLYLDSLKIRVGLLRNDAGWILPGVMIRRGFLDRESRQDLIELARDGSATHRLARRANALVLLDDGIEGVASFGHEGSACRLSEAQQDRLKAWITVTLPRTTREAFKAARA